MENIKFVFSSQEILKIIFLSENALDFTHFF